MNEIEFQEFLIKRNLNDKQIKNYLTKINAYQTFLKQENLTLETVDPMRLVEYTEYLVANEKESVRDFLRATIQYAIYSKNYDFIVAVIDISESDNAMETLFSRLAEVHGETIRNEIFKDLTLPPLGIHPEKKPDFTKVIMNRIEKKLGEEKTIALLTPCLHGRPPDPIEEDKKDLEELGIDDFLVKKHLQVIQRFEKHRNEGTLEFAQYVDDEVVDFIKKNQMFGAGVREGNIIYISKQPYQIKKYLHADDNRMKKYHLCYCPWVRGALKNGTEHELSKQFCQCSADYYKLYWDKIFGQPVKTEPIETALTGSLECKIAIHIPEAFLPSKQE